MQTTGNTILITGGGSGIGRGLAEAFQKLGNKVIIAGRREGVLAETVKANPGMEYLTLDTGSAQSIQAFTKEVTTRFPALNVVVHSAGIMKTEDLRQTDTAIAEETIAINLLGPIRLTAALLPGLLEQPHAAILTVSSGRPSRPCRSTPPTARPRRPSIRTRSRCATSCATRRCESLKSFRPTSRRN
ncbi:SDR family NAD(P)-dependent oxidoreductase [Cystobacter fuscus]